MLIPYQLKVQLKQVLWITIVWTFISIFDFLIRYGTMEYFGIPAHLLHFNIQGFLLQSFLVGLAAGFLGGIILTFLWSKWLRTISYGRVLMGLMLTYTLLFYCISFPTSMIFQSNISGLEVFSRQNLGEAIRYQFTLGSITTYTYWLFVSLGTLIVLQVNDKYGPGVFQDFLLGKYFQPKKEERIFMFLDLRSSTKIAEDLGEVRYFNFLKEVFIHITQPILNHKGEIYQYVGDEVVISWKSQKENHYSDCINCFFEIQHKLLSLQSYYKENYGIQPEFKAGIHSGNVMVGEIGVVKREIAYSGDVLNTTSRIQSLCNEFKANLLVSKAFLDKAKSIASSFQFKEVGDISLRGKAKPMYLFEVVKFSSNH